MTFLWLIFLVIAPPPPAPAATPQDWPAVSRGVWHIEGTLSMPGKKDERWSEDSSQCTEPRFLFQGAFDDGIVERQGCRYQSSRSPDGTYVIIGECAIRRKGLVKSHSTVSVQGNRAFTMTTAVGNGKRQAKIVQIGNWKAGCADER